MELHFGIQNHLPVYQGCVNADGTLRFYKVCYFFSQSVVMKFESRKLKIKIISKLYVAVKSQNLSKSSIELTDKMNFSACSVNFVALTFLVK